MHGVDAVMIRQRQRPRSARLDSDSLHIKAGQRAGSEQRIAQQIALVNLLTTAFCAACAMATSSR